MFGKRYLKTLDSFKFIKTTYWRLRWKLLWDCNSILAPLFSANFLKKMISQQMLDDASNPTWNTFNNWKKLNLRSLLPSALNLHWGIKNWNFKMVFARQTCPNKEFTWKCLVRLSIAFAKSSFIAMNAKLTSSLN